MSNSSANPPLDDHLLHEIHADQNTNTGIENKKLIMWLFLASDCMFFGTLISTHLIYRKLYPFGHPVEGNVNITGTFDIELTSFSTFILLMSSFLMALAVSAMHKGSVESFRRYTFGVIIFGLIFLGGQVYEFQHFFHGQGWYEWKAESQAGQVLIGNEKNKLLFHDVADAGNAKESFGHEHFGLELKSFEFVSGKPGENLPAIFKYEVELPDTVGNDPETFYGEYTYIPGNPQASKIVVLSDIPPPPAEAKEEKKEDAKASEEASKEETASTENVESEKAAESKEGASEETAPAEESATAEKNSKKPATEEANEETAVAEHAEGPASAHSEAAQIPTSQSALTTAAKEAFKHSNFGFNLQEFKAVKTVPGLDLRTSVFGSTFYVMTGTHGTHVAIGVLWLFSMLIYSYSGRLTPRNAVDVEIAGLYWHFVDIVWIVIFTAVYLVEYI